jgi:intracellular multiplication protein IcmW
MPDFSTHAVHEFWSQYPDKRIYRVIAFLEGVENWTLDGDPDVESALAKLGNELDDIANVDLSALGHEEFFVKICNGVKSGRTLRLLQAIDTAQPGSASKLLIHTEENSQSSEDPAGLFLRRNIVFERLRLLSRVFAKERIELVMKALGGSEYE